MVGAAASDAHVYLTSPAINRDVSATIARIEHEHGIAADERRSPDLRLRIDCCRRKRVALLVDEAHMLNPDAMAELLNVAQIVCGQAPLLFGLAGTPHLATLPATKELIMLLVRKHPDWPMRPVHRSKSDAT